MVLQQQKSGGGDIMPFYAHEQNVLFSADYIFILSATLNQKWVCSVNATFGRV